MTDENEILRTVAEYCHAIDERGGDGVADLFSEDASFTFQGETSRGRTEIRARLSSRERPNELIHLAANPIIEIHADSAEGTFDHLLLRRQDDGALVIFGAGRWRDRYVRESGRWLIAERTVEFPYGPPAPPH